MWIEMLRGASQAARTVRDQETAKRRTRPEPGAPPKSPAPEAREPAEEPPPRAPSRPEPVPHVAPPQRRVSTPISELALRIPPPTPPARLRPPPGLQPFAQRTNPRSATADELPASAPAPACPRTATVEELPASAPASACAEEAPDPDPDAVGESTTLVPDAPTEPPPAASERRVEAPPTAEVRELVMVAVAEAVEAVEARRVRSALHALVSAQEEHFAAMLATVQQVREECNATMTRLADRLAGAVERLAGAFESYTDTAIPAALADVGEQVRVSTGEIAGTLRAIVAQNQRVTAALEATRERDERLTTVLECIQAAIEGSAEPQDEQDPDPESLEECIAQPAAREPEGSIYDRIPDDMHDDEDESAGHVH
ncbi:hypothetical protein [Nannocystis pusilla]|nr:hypothetical protein [Nannocystis pusilla]